MTRYLVIIARLDDVIPKLPTFLQCPTISSLIHRDDELRRSFKEVQQINGLSYHCSTRPLIVEKVINDSTLGLLKARTILLPQPLVADVTVS